MGESLADLLRRFRLRAGLTQAALAERAALSEQAVSLLERGTRKRPRLETLRLLGKALGLDGDELGQLTAAARQSQHEPASQHPEAPVLDPADPGPSRVLPRQLPPAIPDFVGRTDELAALRMVLSRSGASPDHVAMVAVTGMGGVGKTALAVQAAQLASSEYPDGHLYVDLRGYGPDEPLTTADALGQLLRSLGVESESIPAAVDEAAALFRTRVAGQRVLVLLDNANGAGQVLPLLPGSPTTAVIVTSRQELTTLPGFTQLALPPLPESDSVDLLARIVGTTRVSDESAAASEITRLTGRLPLAVRLIGARLAARPSWPVEYVVHQLRDEHSRLDQLGTGESGVRASIAGTVEFLATSDLPLDRRAASALSYLGLLNGSHLTVRTTAQLLDDSPRQTELLLERLVDLNLLMSIGPGKYRLHDLIQAFGREQGERTLTGEERDRALGRVLRYFTAVGWACQQLSHQDSPRGRLASAAPSGLPVFAGSSDSLAYLDDERTNIIAAIQLARQSPAARRLIPELSLALFGYFEARYRWTEMKNVDEIGLELAIELGFDHVAAWLEHDLAIPDVEHGFPERATKGFRRSLGIFEDVGDLSGQARCCASISLTMRQSGRLDQALEWGRRALSLSRQVGDRTLEGTAHLALGNLAADRGDTDLAAEHFDLSIALAEQYSSPRRVARRHQGAGETYLRLGGYRRAIPSLTQAKLLFQQAADDMAVAETSGDLATAHLALGDHEAARSHAEAGLRIARALGNTYLEGQLLIVRGRLNAALDARPAAEADWRRAASLLHSQSPQLEAAALNLLADTVERPQPRS